MLRLFVSNWRVGAVIKLERGRVIRAAIQFAEAKFIAHLASRNTAKRNTL